MADDPPSTRTTLRRRGPGPSRGAIFLWGLAALIAIPVALAAVPIAHGTPGVPPFSVSILATPSSGGVPLTIAFTATVSSGTPSSVSWVFGDGSTWSGTGSGAVNVAHRYTAVGSFAPTATVSESTGVASGSTTVNVEAGSLVAVISATPSSGDAPLSVTFRAVVSGGTGTYTALWGFGDGGQGAGPLVNYTFRTAGHFLTTLTVTDSANETSSATFALTVGAAAPSPSNPWSGTGPATIATAGIVGAGLTFGAFYGVRRRRSHRGAGEMDVDETAALPPGIFGPALPGSLGLSAAASSSEAVASEASVVEPPITSPSSGLTPTLETASAIPSVVRIPPTHPARAPGDEPRRWSRDIVAYLGALPNLGPDDIPSIDWTQKGMSDRLGTGQNQVSNVLRRLVGAGLVVEELQHVQGQPRRLKIYRLTMRGETLAREVRRRHPTASNPNLLGKNW